jgi:hypothetical protein
MSNGIPCPQKYAYQSPLLPTRDVDVLAREFLQLVPQLFGFLAGNMSVIMFDLDPVPEEERPVVDGSNASLRQHQYDALHVFKLLGPHQRPNLSFVQAPKDIRFDSNTKFAILNPMDCLEILPQLVPAEGHYTVLSKHTLAKSGLPTPPTTVIDTRLKPEDILTSPASINAESERMLSIIDGRMTPFIIKLPQALSGQGVFIVRNEQDK